MNKSLVMGAPGKRSVEAASEMLKRLYIVEREVMRTLGGYLANISNWELKKLVPHHLWQDSLRADALRTRVLEMRYPRRDVDQGHDPSLLQFLQLLSRGNHDREFVEGIYLVTKRALKAAYEAYLKDADPLDDAPTVVFMKRFPEELEQQLLEGQELYPILCDNHTETAKWHSQLQAYLLDIGGILKKNTDLLDSDKYAELLKRSAYTMPKVPVRDPRFGKALYHMPPNSWGEEGVKLDFIQRQVSMGINHVNEMWACEATGMFMWEWEDMPWEFYTDTARWCYDELRHCMMGEQRLKAWGFEIGVDHAMVADHYISQSDYGPLEMLALLHKFESGSPGWKSGLMKEFQDQGDSASSQDFDYDWADESIHMQYGHKWLMHRLNGDINIAEEMLEEAAERWGKWVTKANTEWDYEPFMSRIHAKIAEIEAKQNE